MTRRVVIEADGGARGNPGPAGWGAVVRDADSGEVLRERCEAIGTATNNVAEYQGLIGGLAAAAELSAATAEVRMDSKLVIEQMTGRWQIKHPGLRPLAAEAAGLVRAFDQVTWQWVPRHRNQHADRLANEAMDAAARGGTPSSASPSGAAPETAASGEAPGSARGSAAAGTADRPPVSPAPAVRTGWDPPDAPPTRLVLLRHGATHHTAERRYSGRTDTPLTPEGRAQGDAAAGRIAQLTSPAAGEPGSVAAVVTSPLRRCTDTAQAVAEALGGPPVVTDDDLIECDFGEWDGCTFDEVRTGWPDALAAWQTRTSVAPPGGESLQRVAKRVRRAEAALAQTYPGQTVVVVSHVWPLKLLLRDALGGGDALLYRLLLAPGGLSVVDRWPDGTVAVHVVNETAHVDPTAR